jgi:hypothetical protein
LPSCDDAARQALYIREAAAQAFTAPPISACLRFFLQQQQQATIEPMMIATPTMHEQTMMAMSAWGLMAAQYSSQELRTEVEGLVKVGLDMPHVWLSCQRCG